MEDWGHSYDEMDAESIVLHGYAEEEEMDPAEAGFLRGYLDIDEEEASLI